MTTYDQNYTIKHYVAEDGTDFTSRDDCLAYEERIRVSKCELKVQNLPHFELCPPMTEDGELLATWYLLKEPSDLENIKTALYCSDCTALDFECASYPAWVVAVTDGEGYGWLESYEGYVKLMQEHLAELSEKVKEVIADG